MYARLRCRIGRKIDRRLDRGTGGNTDDAAALPLLEHLCSRIFRAEHRAIEIHFDDATPQIIIQLLHRHAIAGARVGGIIDQDVDAAERRNY